jgi:hypothetical protein
VTKVLDGDSHFRFLLIKDKNCLSPHICQIDKYLRVDDSSRCRTRATFSNHFQKLTTLTLISFSFIGSPSRKKEKRQCTNQPSLITFFLKIASIKKKKTQNELIKVENKTRQLSPIPYDLISLTTRGTNHHHPIHQPLSTYPTTALYCNSKTPTTVGLTPLLAFLPSFTTKRDTIFHHD